jgi:lipoprotein NlpI
LDFDSDDGSAHDLAARVAMQQGHPQKALDHWRTAGKLHCGVEAWNLAEVSFAFALGINPSQVDVLCGLALAQIKNGQFVSAQTTIDTLSQLDPGNPEVVELQRLLP